MDVAFGPQRGALRLEYVSHFFSSFRISLVSCQAVFSSLDVTPISDEPMSTKVLIVSCSGLCHLVRTTNALTPTDDVQRLLSRCRPCPQFYVMAVGVLRPAVHNTLLNIGNMPAIRCTSRSVPPVPVVDDLYC
ncbi:hypothetical protein MTO96_025076 [Rhipicephalus appendiculatus]